MTKQFFERGAKVVLAQRGWQAIAGVINLAFVAHFLSPAEQGYFYTLASMAALHMALDMGLSGLLVQFGAREFLGHSWGPGGLVEGIFPSRFLGLVGLSLRWYGLAALVFLLAYPLGLVFVSASQDGLAYDWPGAWALLVCATAANVLFFPVLALTEGSGGVSEAYAVRLVQGVAGAGSAWVVLALGGGLFAVAMPALGSAVVAALWVWVRRRRLVVQALRQRTGSLHWGDEVWPLQWRIGASWLAGYVLVLMHVPLLFRTQGAVAAGQMGVTMTVANMMSLLASSWMTARIPVMAQAVATEDWAHLDQVFGRALRNSTLAFAAGAGLFLMLRFLLQWTPYGTRFLSVMETAGLLLAMGFYHASGLFAAYLRAHMREPFLWPSLVGALLTACAALWAAPQWGAGGVVIVLLVVNIGFFFPVARYLWSRLRREWHGEMP